MICGSNIQPGEVGSSRALSQALGSNQYPGVGVGISLHLCETLHPLDLPSSLLLQVVRRGTMAMNPLLKVLLGHQALCQTGCSQSKASSHPLLLWGQDPAW